MMNEENQLREQLSKFLDWDHAHVSFDQAMADFPFDLADKIPKGMAHSAWQLLEHMRIAQWDIYEFSVSAEHISPKWPEEYWPKNSTPPDKETWVNSIKNFRNDLKKIKKLVTDPAIDLFARIPHGTGQTLIRESLLVLDHNAYHLAQLVDLRRALGIWPPNK
jgi:hypothetical protein